MVPKRLLEDCCLNAVSLSLQRKARRLLNPQSRQWLACICATLTMVMAGTVYGWTTTLLLHLTSGTGDVPLTLTHDESSWIVSLTVLGSMIGSLVGAQLADRRGRKCCLLICCTIFSFGWLIIYDTTSVPILYFARMVHGTGVGIAYTINPMYVSEVADVNMRGAIATLIAVNVFTGSLLTCILGHWLTYKSLLVVLVIISFTSFLTNTCFPETPYFLVSKGRKKQACKSITYYKGIVDPNEMKIALRALCPQTRCKLQPQAKSDFPPQSRIDLSSQSTSDSLPQFTSDFIPQSTSDFTLSSRNYFASQSGSGFPSISLQEVHSDPIWEVVDTEFKSDLHSPSSSDSHSQSTYVIHSEVICEVHPQPTGELRLQPSRDSIELPLQPQREFHPQSTSGLHLASRSEVQPPSTSEIYPPSTSEIYPESTSEIHPEHTSGIHPEPTSEIHHEPTSEIHPEPTSGIHPEPVSEIHPEPTCEIHPEHTSGIHPEPTSEIHPEPTSEIHPEPTSGIHPEPVSEIHPEPVSEIHPEPTCEIHPEPTSEIYPRTRSQLQSRSRCELPTQYSINFPSPGCTSSVESRGSIGSNEQYVGVTKQTWLSKLRAIQQRNNRKALFLMLGLIMAQQLSGNFITIQYLEVLFSKTTIGIQPNLATILVLAVGLLSGILSTLTVESLGRRTLLILSTLGSCFTLFILATYLLLDQYKFDVSIVSTLPVIDLIIYQVMYQIGLGTLPNVLLCELFPAELKGFAGAIIVIFNGIIGFTVSKLYQVIIDDVGPSAIYFIFATACCLAFLMVFKWVPETKGKTYHEIKALLIGKNLTSLYEEVRTNETDIRRI